MRVVTLGMRAIVQRSSRTLLLGAIVFLMLVPGSVQAGFVKFVDEAFTGATAPGWVFVTGQGDGPSLTAAGEVPIDTPGQGWLRLTKDIGNQSSFVYYNSPIPTQWGLVLSLISSRGAPIRVWATVLHWSFSTRV
jgi:hypothetical protein